MKAQCLTWSEAIEDFNVANHLFRLPESLLEQPGLILAHWSNNGDLRDETIWTFRELQTRVRQCIVVLQESGIRPGQRVLLMVRPGLELITLCFALFRVGAIPVVIDPGMGIGKFKKAVKHSEPEALVGIPLAHQVSRIFPKSFASIQERLIVHPKRFLGKLDKADLNHPIELTQTSAHDLAAVLFTSGSTGAPKGVCYEHSMFDAQIRLLKDALNIGSGEVDLPMLPIFALFNPALGMTTVIPEINPSRPATVNPAKIVAAVKRYNVTNSFGSPVLWRKIGDYCDSHGYKLESLKRILVAGAAAPTQLYRQYQNILVDGEMYSPYGATECLPVSLTWGNAVLNETAALTDEGHGICVGKPLTEVQVKIVKPLVERNDALEELPIGEIGEILVHGPSVTKVYDRLPEATSASKYNDVGQVWHRMGDLGYLDAQGRLWFCGRKVESVVDQNGIRYYTEKVEGPFLTHPNIKRCALTTWKNPERGDIAEIALVIQPIEGAFPRGKEARKRFAKSVVEHLNNNIRFSPVEVVFFMKSLPVDVRHNAKIHRLTLQQMIQHQKPVRLEIV